MHINREFDIYVLEMLFFCFCCGRSISFLALTVIQRVQHRRPQRIK